MISKDKLKVGLQVVYIPPHVIGKYNAPEDYVKDHEVELGFITSWNDSFVFCRFFSKQFKNMLRTLANSEACGYDELLEFNHHDQFFVDRIVNEIYSEWDASND